MADEEPQPTEYAKRYGVEQRNRWKSKGQSGLSPLDPPDPNITLSEESIQDRQNRNGYQRRNLKGFTSRELLDSGCLNNDYAPSNGLTNPIHPMLQLDRWRAGDIPLPGSLPGVWEAQNPLVAAILEPSLKLATLILHSSPLWLWFDGAQHGPRFLVPKSDMEKDGGEAQGLTDDVYSFNLRPSEVSGSDPNGSRNTFEDLAYCLFLKFMPGQTLPDGTPNPRGSILGNYRPYYMNNGEGRHIYSEISLSVDYFACLLVPGMTTSEVLVQQFLIAKTIVHETSHALIHVIESKAGRRPWDSELFFEQEEMAECGRSAENAIWGGAVHSILYRDTAPKMAAFVTNWVNWKHHFGDGRYNTQTRAIRCRYHDHFDESNSPLAWIWPIQISWISDIQQWQHWTVIVSKIGQAAFYPPRVIGLVYSKGKRADGKEKLPELIYGPQFTEWVKGPRNFNPSPEFPPTVTNFELFDIDNARRQRAEAVKLAMSMTSIGYRVTNRP